MYTGGYMGKILRINMTEQTSSVEEVSEELARNFIGGAGFGIKYLYDEINQNTDPLGPDNKLIFAVGPFTGTSIPCASRMAVVSKSPATNAVAAAFTGGYFPAELKFTGYDMLIIEGKAQKPTYLWIKDNKVRFRDAADLWGTHTGDCQQMIKNKLGDQNIRIACIGPAGENQSKMAAIMNEKRAAGRKGVGAVMGSKNLKAIVIRGEQEVLIADADKYKKATRDMSKIMKESPVLYSGFSRTGTAMAVDHTIELGIFPAKNFSATGEFAPAKELGLENQNDRKVAEEHCYACPVGCIQVKLAKNDYAGSLGEPEFETLYSLGGVTGVDNNDAIIAADRLCDELGIDSISAGATIGFAMELFEKGVLTTADTDGLDLKFGNHEAMIEVLNKMARRKGFGELLADGIKAAAEKIGKEAEPYALHVKGLELPGYDVRGAKAHGLNYATSYTGADHCRGYAPQEIFGSPFPKEVDRFSIEGKGELTKWNQDTRSATMDCPTLCAFLLDMAFPGNATENAAALIEAVSGLALTPDEVYAAGERLNNVARAFNIREAGMTRADDTLPNRLMTEIIKEGGSKGQLISQEDLDTMLNEYYTARGWDPQTGVPTRGKLESLGLGYIADQLGV